MAAVRKGQKPAPNLEPLWERLQGQIGWYDRKAKSNQRAYKVSKISIIVLAILIPVFAAYGHIPGFEESRAFLVGAAAGVKPRPRNLCTAFGRSWSKRIGTHFKFSLSARSAC